MTRMRTRNQNNGGDTNSPGRTGRGLVKKLTLIILDILRHNEKLFHSFTLYASRKCCHSIMTHDELCSPQAFDPPNNASYRLSKVGRSYERSDKNIE